YGTVETPAYKRREIQRENEMYKKKMQRTQRQNNPSTVLKKDPNIPFRPSKVASPIYGYQERKENEKIANVPAYIRKQGNNRVHRETEKNDAIVPVQNKEYSAHESSNEKQIINNDKKWFQSSGRDNNAINQTAIRSSERNLKMGEKTNTNSQQAEMQKQNTSVRSDNPKPLHQTRNGNIKKSRSNNKKQHGRDQQP